MFFNKKDREKEKKEMAKKTELVIDLCKSHDEGIEIGYGRMDNDIRQLLEDRELITIDSQKLIIWKGIIDNIEDVEFISLLNDLGKDNDLVNDYEYPYPERKSAYSRINKIRERYFVLLEKGKMEYIHLLDYIFKFRSDLLDKYSLFMDDKNALSLYIKSRRVADQMIMNSRRKRWKYNTKLIL